MKDDLNAQQREIIDSLNNEEEFIQRYFPLYIELSNDIMVIEKEKENIMIKQAEFEKWVQEGEIIDAEFEEIN